MLLMFAAAAFAAPEPLTFADTPVSIPAPKPEIVIVPTLLDVTGAVKKDIDRDLLANLSEGPPTRVREPDPAPPKP